MKHLLLLLAIGLLPICSTAQDLTGTWTGTIKKSYSSEPFIYDMIIKKDGSGWSWIAYKNEQWYCNQAHSGAVSENRYTYKGSRFVVHHHERGAYWLLIRGTLKYDPEKDKLYGWVDAYDYYTKSLYKEHDYVELFRIKEKVVNLGNPKLSIVVD